MAQQCLPVPPVWIVIDGLGAACLALGVFGLVGSPEGAWATLATPVLAWFLIGLGGVAMAVGMSMIVMALTRRQRETSRR